MTAPSLQLLLEKAATSGLSVEEESELARLLEDPTNRQAVEAETALLCQRLGAALREREPTAPPSPPPSDEQRARFEQAIARLGAQAKRANRPQPGRLLPFAAILAAAACLALWLWPRASVSAADARIELALIAPETTTRNLQNAPAAALGAEWRIVAMRDLPALGAWTAQPLPAEVKARLWIDEEAGLLRGITRAADGSLKRASQAIEPATPVESQLTRFSRALSTP